MDVTGSERTEEPNAGEGMAQSVREYEVLLAQFQSGQTTPSLGFLERVLNELKGSAAEVERLRRQVSDLRRIDAEMRLRSQSPLAVSSAGGSRRTSGDREDLSVEPEFGAQRESALAAALQEIERMSQMMSVWSLKMQEVLFQQTPNLPPGPSSDANDENKSEQLNQFSELLDILLEERRLSHLRTQGLRAAGYELEEPGGGSSEAYNELAARREESLRLELEQVKARAAQLEQSLQESEVRERRMLSETLAANLAQEVQANERLAEREAELQERLEQANVRESDLRAELEAAHQSQDETNALLEARETELEETVEQAEKREDELLAQIDGLIQARDGSNRQLASRVVELEEKLRQAEAREADRSAQMSAASRAHDELSARYDSLMGVLESRQNAPAPSTTTGASPAGSMTNEIVSYLSKRVRELEEETVALNGQKAEALEAYESLEEIMRGIRTKVALGEVWIEKQTEMEARIEELRAGNARYERLLEDARSDARKNSQELALLREQVTMALVRERELRLVSEQRRQSLESMDEERVRLKEYLVRYENELRSRDKKVVELGRIYERNEKELRMARRAAVDRERLLGEVEKLRAENQHVHQLRAVKESLEQNVEALQASLMVLRREATANAMYQSRLERTLARMREGNAGHRSKSSSDEQAHLRQQQQSVASAG
ncbi:hypothetical protein FVE85_9119 [Porphyridium purpureum]|uniref:Uncharacterized protein n=1 Tax=Porphyridium purpureum TaxID=35688 RepID=A0A5J4YR15_PORPP|nr:hypothetical protein FVE85_9119 [Porphyridium purpureum]|eukprot:POR0989..scf222_8